MKQKNKKPNRFMAYRAIERESMNGGDLTARADKALESLLNKTISSEELTFWYLREKEFRSLNK